jgi:UDP-N-acetylmuramate: L-alanyl-gamma-D-glutamyl-meso-diaminopimelate ligase
MHVHILGICGTFMGGIAAIARAAGHKVTGSDQNVYPPMSTQLAALGIDIVQGYGAEQLDPAPDVVVVGNVMSRGKPVVEALLSRRIPYASGPEWLARAVLRDRHVLAVAGTHGKTTTTSMLAHILDHAGLDPGFLVGGVPGNFDVSARLGSSPFFVIEADEYDTAFFDKRAKFVHYHPRTLVLNNLEFDHADIYPDLEAIKRQFSHLLRIVPGDGLVVHNAADANLDDVIARGCWTPREGFARDGAAGARWSASPAPTIRASRCCWMASPRAPWTGACWARTTSTTRWPPSPPRGTPGCRWPRPSRPWGASAACGGAWSWWARSPASASTTTSPTIPPRSPRPSRA